MKVQAEKNVTIWSRICLFMAVMLVGAIIFSQASLVVNAQGKATVTATSGKIRKSAGTDSEVLASVQKDDELDVIAQTTDSDGYTWYKVYVNGSDTGYIRADLVSEVSGSISNEDTASTDSNNSTQQEEKAETNAQQSTEFVQISATTVTAAKVTGGSVNVRNNPTTKAAVAGKATEGTEVTVSGEAVDGDGKVWYQVSFGDVSGFIRSDFLEVTQTQEAVEEPVEEQEEPAGEEPVEAAVNKDYELVYEANAEGVEEWFLYDHTRGTKQSLTDILTVVRQTKENEQGAVARLKTFKIIVIVMAAVILALIIGITVLVFKLRDSYEYEYDDDEDDEDEEEDDDDEDDEEEDDDDDEVDEEDELLSSKRLLRKASKPAKTSGQSVRNSKPAEKALQGKKDTTWQSKNFLDIDDDMEFEFLDLK